MSDSLKILIEAVVSAIEPLTQAADDPGVLANLLDALGASDPKLVDGNLVPALRALGQGIQDVSSVLAAPDFSLATAQVALDALRSLFTAVRALGANDGSAYPEFGADVLNLVLTDHLRNVSPLCFQLGASVGIVKRDVLPSLMVAEQLARPAKPVDRLVLNNLGALLRNPAASIQAELPSPMLSTVTNAQRTADVMVDRLGGVLNALGIPWSYGFTQGDDKYLGEAAEAARHTLVLNVPFDIAQGVVAGACVALSSADADDLGVVLTPFGALNHQATVGAWTITVQLSADVGALAFGGGQGVQLLVNTGQQEVHGSVTATPSDVSANTPLRIGSATGTRLEFGQPQASLGLIATLGSVEVALGVNTGESALVITGGDADGFLSSLLPPDGLRTTFDLGLNWSSRKGLTLRGSAGLEATLPIGLSVAGVTLSNIHLALQARDERVSAEVSASLLASIGPVQASVERIGVTGALTFPQTGGNLGVADLDLGLKPPSGIGLSIDAHGVLTGGGFLFHDPAQGTYAGVMQLSLHDQITLSAYGLIATRMPDGSRGYSMLVFITAEGFKPIPLGFGFMLQAIGGMVGVHRTFDDKVIAAGLKTDSLSGLLFPRDPVANAPALIQALAAAFPARQGSYLLGLLARITWFTPTLVQLDLALILEFGARTRLLALGRVSALLPSRDNDLIRLNMDALGVLDFDAGSLGVDAVLVDSRLAHQFPITGSAALRARWAGDANFVLAVGGLNPRFAPPAGFPALERVAIALCSGNNPRLICDAYLAITANTVQFGSRVSLYAEALGFSVAGDLGFDALVTLLPPHFIIDFHAAVQLKRDSHNLFKVTLDGTLEGPLPLRLAAKATFEILWFSFSVHFDFMLAAGDGAQAVPPALDLASELMKVLADPASWSTRRAPLLAHGVALRGLPASAGLVLDPLGQLLVQQQLVPLNTLSDVDTYGGTPVTGARRFKVAASLNGKAGTTVAAAFARARYFVMSDDEKLAAPSFVSMDAGLLLSDEAVTFDAATIVPAPLQYEAITLNPPAAPGVAAAAAAPPPAPLRYTLPVAAFTLQRPSGAAARVPLRRAGRARFRHAAAVPAATLVAPRWRLVQTSDGAIAPDDPNVSTWAEQRAALAVLNRGGARWLMVPAHELLA